MSTALIESAESRQVTKRRGGSIYLYLMLGLLSVATIRVVTGTHEIDSEGTLRAAVIATGPILLAALGGLWSERAGVVNIGLAGQMLLGTWGAADFTYYCGP